MQWKRILKRKRWFLPIATILWPVGKWLVKELATDTLMQAIRDYLGQQGFPMLILNYIWQNPLIIVGVSAIGVFVWAYLDTKHESEQTKHKLPEILTNMHERLMALKKSREKIKLDRRQFEAATPVLLDNLELVKFNDYEFRKQTWERELRKLVPKSRKKLLNGFWRLRVISRGKEIRNELIRSKEWKVEDASKVGEWLDSIGIGIGMLQANDEEYQKLVKSIRQFMTDSVLRKLIEKHMSLSYACCSASLDLSYSRRLVKNSVEQIAHSALVGSELSPHKIELALSEVLEEIEGTTFGGNRNDVASSLEIVNTYEDNSGECGLLFRNISNKHITGCQAILIDLAFEVPHHRYSLERYPKREDLICPQNIAQFGSGKIPLFRWQFSGGGKDLEIVCRNKSCQIGYGIRNIPILILLNLWAKNVSNTYAVCKLEDRLGWGFKLTILKTGLQQEQLIELSTFQTPNDHKEGFGTE